MDTMSGVALNPSAIPADTSVDVWKREMEGRRLMSDEKRMALFASFHRKCLDMQDQAIRNRFPEVSDLEFKVERARRRHGEEVAEVVRAQLLARHR
jgi:hypothetical protein